MFVNVQQNTELTSLTKKRSEHIEELTLELHKRLLENKIDLIMPTNTPLDDYNGVL